MSVRDYGVAGPNMNPDQPTPNIGDMSVAEASAINTILKPDDIYDENGTYFADLPLAKQFAFNSRVDGREARRELRTIGSMIKNDPLSPVSYYMKNMVLPGAGLLLEGYVLFSIGNVQPLLQGAFPQCWNAAKVKHPICNLQWIYALQYLEIIGIICGQILVGILGDWLGRRWGLIQDAAIMFIGLLMLTAAWGVTQNGWVICYAWSLWFYSIGVGGEYPMTATSGMENAVGSGKISTKEDRLHRGRKVTSAFLMQGWGQFFNQVILIICLLIFHGKGEPPYSRQAAQWTYRVSFAIPAAGTLWLVYYRIWKMKSASKQLEVAKRRQNVTGYDRQSLKLTFSYFGPRILATAGTWFMNDVFFYGNKLFINQFIKVITHNSSSVMIQWLYNLINVGVSLVGYYLASFLIDNKMYGRKWMMIVGFMLDFILFVIPAFNYHYYSSLPHIHAFQAMYFLSSFFNQFGPNSVTFIVAAEVYPTPIRATAHGFSAAWGKLGALLAAVLYNYLNTQQIFYFVPWFGLAGAFLTLLFLPDTTGLDLKEQERRWYFIRSGREHEYHGIAVHPRHLSLWERFVKRKSKYYDPELDYQQRVDDLRKDWQERQAELAGKEEGAAFDDEYPESLHDYFSRTSGPRGYGYGNGNGSGDAEKKSDSDDSMRKR